MVCGHGRKGVLGLGLESLEFRLASGLLLAPCLRSNL